MMEGCFHLVTGSSIMFFQAETVDVEEASSIRLASEQDHLQSFLSAFLAGVFVELPLRQLGEQIIFSITYYSGFIFRLKLQHLYSWIQPSMVQCLKYWPRKQLFPSIGPCLVFICVPQMLMTVFFLTRGFVSPSAEFVMQFTGSVNCHSPLQQMGDCSMHLAPEVSGQSSFLSWESIITPARQAVLGKQQVPQLHVSTK